MIGSVTRWSDSTQDRAFGRQLFHAVLILGACALIFLPSVHLDSLGIDSRAVWSGAHGFVTNGDPYTGGSTRYPFVYLPSCAVIFAPFAALSAHTFAVGMLLLDQLALVALGLGYASVAGLRATSGRATAIVIALLLCPLGINTVALGNASILVAALGVWSLILICRDRPYGAAVLLGVALAIKPLVVFILLVFFVRKAFRPLSVAVAIPLIMNVAALPFVSDPLGFVSRAVPHLLNGGLVPSWFNASIWARGNVIHAPTIVVLLAQLLVAAAACLGIYAWRGALELRGYAILSSVPAVGIFLISHVDEPHFNLVTLTLCSALVVQGVGIQRYIAVVATLILSLAGLPALTSVVSAAQFAVILLALSVSRRRSRGLPTRAQSRSTSPREDLSGHQLTMCSAWNGEGTSIRGCWHQS